MSGQFYLRDPTARRSSNEEEEEEDEEPQLEELSTVALEQPADAASNADRTTPELNQRRDAEGRAADDHSEAQRRFVDAWQAQTGDSDWGLDTNAVQADAAARQAAERAKEAAGPALADDAVPELSEAAEAAVAATAADAAAAASILAAEETPEQRQRRIMAEAVKTVRVAAELTAEDNSTTAGNGSDNTEGSSPANAPQTPVDEEDVDVADLKGVDTTGFEAPTDMEAAGRLLDGSSPRRSPRRGPPDDQMGDDGDKADMD